jgi:GNAT superfamily N-acetyltransferase
MMPSNNLTVQEDIWLSGILKKKAYRANLSENVPMDMGNTGQLLFSQLSDLDFPIFCYIKMNVNEITSIKLIESAGFNLIDTNIVFQKVCRADFKDAEDFDIFFASEIHRKGVAAIAENSFEFSRFHLDDKISNHVANEIKHEWALNYFNRSRGDRMVIAMKKGRVIGFLQLIFYREKLIVDLIAVDKQIRKKGVAKKMIEFAQHHLEQFETIQVGTQIANIPSMRVYDSLGFKIVSADYIFHLHLGIDL